MKRAVALAVGTRMWQGLAAPVTVLIVARAFSAEEQGFYYTFASLLALQVLFELGLSVVITQHSAHEFVDLAWSPDGMPLGAEAQARRYIDFLHAAVRWYVLAAIGFIVVAMPVGLLFFGAHTYSDTAALTWRLPWALAVCAVAVNLPLVPLLAALEGSGELNRVYGVRFLQTIVTNAVLWLALLSGVGLYAVAIAPAAGAITVAWWLARARPQLLAALAPRRAASGEGKPPSTFSWKHEIWPVQWRMAISFSAGYFIAQIFVPIVFHYHGPALAGRLGMTLAITSMLGLVGMSFIGVNLSRLGKLSASRNWLEFDAVFHRALVVSTAVYAAGAVLFTALSALFSTHPLAQRLLEPADIAILFAAGLANHLIGALATYLRAHKREPFAALSVIGALLTVALIWPAGAAYGVRGIALGSLAINILYGLPTAMWLWSRSRRAWHGEEAENTGMEIPRG